MLFLFDVDGTLTPSRGMINQRFKRYLMEEMSNPFVLVTGSDPDKTREQIGDDLYDSTTVYNCCGNHVFSSGVEIYRSNWQMPKTLESFLTGALEGSTFAHKTGRHLEHRIGLCNFSIVGRNANQDQRKEYFFWDQIWKERINLVNQINRGWPDVEASVAGETGTDIYMRGAGKEQVLDQVKHLAPLRFFGDKMDPAGNDYALAEAIRSSKLGVCYHVKDWMDTWETLRGMGA